MEEKKEVKKPTWKIKLVFSVCTFMLNLLVDNDDENYQYNHLAREAVTNFKKEIAEILKKEELN